MSWTDKITETGVYSRLCNCTTQKSDIPFLVDAKWADMMLKGKDKEGFTKEDALVSVLELLDANGRYFDLTKEEYADLCA